MSTPNKSWQNPYAPPPLYPQGQVYVAEVADFPGLWRAGNVLVMHRQAMLPPICVKSGVATEGRLRRRLTWFPAWAWLGILGGLLPLLIILLLVQKTANIEIGLSPEWKTRRMKRMLIAWGLFLAAIGFFFGGINLLDGQAESTGAMLMTFGILLGLGSALYGAIAARMVRASRIDDHFIWLKGVCPELLAQLPPWEGRR